MSYSELVRPFLESSNWLVDSAGLILHKDSKSRVYFWVVSYEVRGSTSVMVKATSLDNAYFTYIYGSPNVNGGTDWNTYELHKTDDGLLVYTGTLTAVTDLRQAFKALNDYMILENLIT